MKIATKDKPITITITPGGPEPATTKGGEELEKPSG